MATIDVLGEDITTKEEALSALSEAKMVLDVIKSNDLDANISVKLSQLGLIIDKEFCLKNMIELMEYAKKLNNFIRIDMEDSTTTDDTIELYRKIRSNYNNVGLVLQAYLKRTYSDAEKIIEYGPHFRLCKGIYVEDASIAIKDHDGINENYLKILRMMLSKKAYVGIATHDDYLIKSAKAIIDEMKLNLNEYEFQMLLGVKPETRNRIAAEGYRIRVYVPFGIHWYKYSIRRLKENPKMTGYIIKSLFFKG
jgi:proline dehydrogenase